MDLNGVWISSEFEGLPKYTGGGSFSINLLHGCVETLNDSGCVCGCSFYTPEETLSGCFRRETFDSVVIVVKIWWTLWLCILLHK